jgi:signal transduction histidine kinase
MSRAPLLRARALPSVRKYGLCPTPLTASVQRVQFHDSLEAEQARFIHRSVPTAVFGGLTVVGLVVAVFHNVVPDALLRMWFGSFAVLAVVRMPSWLRFRTVKFGPGTSRQWLRRAVIGSLASGVLWGVGSLFMFPPGQLVYHYTFAVVLIFMSVAGMFSYGPHYPTFLAFFLPAIIPAGIGLAVQGGNEQRALAIGAGILSLIVLLSLRSFNRMFTESMRLRFENLELVGQLTAQKEAAESANLAKSRFLAAASHDLRQPIHALNLYLGAFAQLPLSQPAGALLRKVRQCASMMDEMFRTLLDVSKLDAGAVKPQFSVFAIAPLLARAKLEFEPQARAKGLALRVPRCSAFGKSDPVLVERILRNLVSNAIRYTETGSVIVGCRRVPGALRVSVYDTGVGIEQSEQSLVFEEFYQVGNRERDRSKGLGLGLAIVERLARLLDAPVTLRSQKGRGSLFAFDLERADPVELVASPVTRPMGSTRDLTGTLVVVVDDEELILDAAQILLRQWNCTVIAATSGPEALRQLADSKRPPDVLICDYRLRDNEDGVGVIEVLRNEFNDDIPALLITGDTDPEQIRIIAASGLAVLHKPLREDELNDAICALCAPASDAELTGRGT